MCNNTVQVEYWAGLKYWISNIQARIFVNVTNFSFLFVVPALYGAIFKFRKMHTISIQGIFLTKIISPDSLDANSMEIVLAWLLASFYFWQNICNIVHKSLFIWTFAWPFNATNDNANKQVTSFLFRDKWNWKTEKETEQLPFNKNQLLGLDDWGSHLVGQEILLVPKILKSYNREIGIIYV